MSSSAISPDADVALRLNGVTIGYDGAPVLSNLDGAVYAGASLALVGPNGAGKSTLIKSILGLVPVLEGSIEVLGTTPAKARSMVAYVPQADSLDRSFPVSVLEVVIMGRYRKVGWLRRPGKSDRQAAMDALHQVGLADESRRQFGRLSGGQQQRVLIARAISQEARVLLLDEPFNGVDATSTNLVLGVMAQMRDDGAAIVMSTHDLSVAHLACTQACLVNHHQFGFGPIEQTLTPDLLNKTYGDRAGLLAGTSTVIATQ